MTRLIYLIRNLLKYDSGFTIYEDLALDAEPVPCYKQERLPMTQHEQKSTLILALGGLTSGALLLLFGGEQMEKFGILLLAVGLLAGLVRLGSFLFSRKSGKNMRRKPNAQAPAETDAELALRIMTMQDDAQRHYEALPPSARRKSIFGGK